MVDDNTKAAFAVVAGAAADWGARLGTWLLLAGDGDDDGGDKGGGGGVF